MCLNVCLCTQAYKLHGFCACKQEHFANFEGTCPMVVLQNQSLMCRTCSQSVLLAREAGNR